MPMRLGFFGTPELSAQYLEALARRHEIVGVVTQPDRRRGRGSRCEAPPVKAVAARLGVPVLQPERGQCPQACAQLEREAPEVCVVVAFGRRLPCGARECKVGRSVNVHYSLLPRLRGPAPVQHAILQGLDVTGVTIQHLAPGIDEGDIIAQRAVEVLPDDTCGSLTARLTEAGVPLLLETLEALAAGAAGRVPQDPSQATYAPLISKQDGRIDWGEPAEVIARKVRAFNPWPTAFSVLEGRLLRILRARAEDGAPTQAGQVGQVVELLPGTGFAVGCGKGRLWVEEVQAEGRKPLPVAEYLRGARLSVGARFD